MKKTISLLIGVLLMFLSRFLPLPIDSGTLQVLGIFIGAIWLWITYSIEVGSILTLIALCLLPDITTNFIIANSFGTSVIWFLVFSMMLTYALSSTGVLKRVAIWFIDNPIAKKNTRSFMGLYFLAILILGSFMAPTVSFILFFGLVKEIYSLLGLKPGDKLARNLMIGTGFYASISCALTPIAHTFPLMAMGNYETLTNEVISYAEYLKLGLPAGLVIALVAYLLLTFSIPNESYNFNAISFQKKSKWTKTEILSVIIFFCVIACWLIVGIWPETFSHLKSLGTVWPAMIGVVILVSIKAFDIKESISKGVSWSAILLCAATLALGKCLTAEQFGIIPYITGFFASMNTEYILLIIAAFTILLTNLISNIVTTTVAFNLFVPMLLATGSASPITATIIIGFCASLAYVFPSSIAHIALAGSSGWATSKDMIKYGIILAMFSYIVIGVCVI